MTNQERYSDYGTAKQAAMKNRIVLGEGRGIRKRAYVLSNMDVIMDFDKDILRPVHVEAGKAYWAWRDIASKEQGYGESPAYSDRVDDPDNFMDADPLTESEAEPGAVREQFIILCGLMDPTYRQTVDACCNDADEQNPIQILQAFQMMGLCAITFAFEALERDMRKARNIFEERCNKAVDAPMEIA